MTAVIAVLSVGSYPPCMNSIRALSDQSNRSENEKRSLSGARWRWARRVVGGQGGESVFAGDRSPSPGHPPRPGSTAESRSTNVERGQQRPWTPVARAAATVIATAGLILLAAACSQSPSSTASRGTSNAGGATNSHSATSKALAYSRCMRAHGVPNFPDPDSSGQIPVSQVKNLPTSPSVMRAADSHCSSLYPTQPGINAPFSNQQKQDYLRASTCMRQHGILNFPDPIFSGTQVQLPIPPGVDTNSPQFIQARQTCAQLIPAGLPYSGNS